MRAIRGIMLWLLIILATVLVPTWLVLRTALTVPIRDALASGERLLASKKVLVVCAHPDDAEWWIAGTLRKLSVAGAQVRVIIASDGERGPNKVNSANLRETRRSEAREAALIAGYTPVFWSLPDRAVAAQSNLASLIENEWRKMSPDTIITFDGAAPAMPYLHIDHEGIGRIVMKMWRGKPVPRPSLFLFHTRRPNTAVDISDVMDEKVKALQRHKSQGLDNAGERNKSFSGGRLAGVKYAEYFRELK